MRSVRALNVYAGSNRIAYEAQIKAAGGDFIEALAMINRLPLTDAEKAEAVRRLLSAGKR